MHSKDDIDTAVTVTAEELAKIPDSLKSLRFSGYPG
jgi:hypothetical protein